MKTTRLSRIRRRRLASSACLWLFVAAAGTFLPGPTCVPDPIAIDGPILEVTESDHMLAVGDPLVTVIEYSDFECPNCRRFMLETFPTIRREYVDTGQVRWVFRHMPLQDIHPNAELAARAAECAADQGVFWEYHDLLAEGDQGRGRAGLLAYAVELELDPDSFDVCIDSEETAARVQEDLDMAARALLPGTPTFLIGNMAHFGFRTVSMFGSLLDEELGNAANSE